MSLKSLEGFIEIYLNSTKLIRSAGSVTEQRNLAMIRNSSVAMLIENGLSYRISGGYISISTDERDEAFPLMDIFIYMSDSWKERIRYEAEIQSYRPMIEAPYEERTEKSVEVFEETEPVEMEETLSERQENTEMQLKDMTYEFSQIRIMDKKTGEELKDANGEPVTAEKEYTVPGEKGTLVSGEVELEFTVDASSFTKETSVVAFERIERDGRELAMHADLEDDDQTIHYGGIVRTIANFEARKDMAVI